MKTFGFILAVTLITLGGFGGKVYAQSNAELTAAITGGGGDVTAFFDKYKNNPQALGNLDPKLIENAVKTSGISALTNAMDNVKLSNLLSSIGDQGSQDAAIAAAGILTAIAKDNSALGEAITTTLGNSFMTKLDDQVAGLANALDAALAPLFNLTNGLNGILSGFSGLFGGGNSGSISAVLSGITPGSLFGASAGAGGSTALPTASPISATCNEDILISMKTRAWLEAQREITQNQNIIAKPDSVMEYTCFDSFLNVLALQAENMFSENTSAWSGSPALVTNSDMDGALNKLIGTAINSYITKNFAHTSLGGRGSTDYTPTTISGASYTCDRMNAVWMNAKCMNFSTNAQDGFLTFEQHASTDTRQFPEACAAPEAKWDPYIEEAFNNPGWKEDFNDNIVFTRELALEYTLPNYCGSKAIMTGLAVYDEGQKYADGICTNPGCYYVPTRVASSANTLRNGTCAPY